MLASKRKLNAEFDKMICQFRENRERDLSHEFIILALLLIENFNILKFLTQLEISKNECCELAVIFRRCSLFSYLPINKTVVQGRTIFTTVFCQPSQVMSSLFLLLSWSIYDHSEEDTPLYTCVMLLTYELQQQAP